ncbi:MAG: hypothetical protein MJ063_01250 [Lachnospiraceae bacterium]|nr:hypothetical protein [Lachnospiraceae bacterium]
MKNIKRKICEILIAALCFVNIPFTGMVFAAAEDPVPFYKATASDYAGAIPKYYDPATETATSSYVFKDRAGVTRYRVFGSTTKEGIPTWFEADSSGEPAATLVAVATESEYKTLAPIEYEIKAQAEYTNDMWQAFYDANAIYSTGSAGSKELRTEYTKTYNAGFSASVLSYDAHYNAFGAFEIKGLGDAPIEYVAYGRKLNDGEPGEMGWFSFANGSVYTYTVKYVDGSGNVIGGYSDGIRGTAANTGTETVSPIDITGYTKPAAQTVDADGKLITFVYSAHTYTIKNYNFDATRDEETVFTYDAAAEALTTGSAHDGYVLQAYKVSSGN